VKAIVSLAAATQAPQKFALEPLKTIFPANLGETHLNFASKPVAIV
jgi:hypothetical protein